MSRHLRVWGKGTGTATLSLIWRIILHSLSSDLDFYVKETSIIFTQDIFCFKKGEDKFLKEFDAVEFVRTQRKLKMLMNSLMNEDERFFTPYQKTNALSLLSNSDNSDFDDHDYTKIPKFLSSAKIKQRHSVIIDKFFVSAL